MRYGQPPTYSRMSRISHFAFFILHFVFVLCLAGCGGSTPDSHPEVFKTNQQVAGERLAVQQAQWQQEALSVLKLDRPDITAARAGTTAIALGAAGRQIDLASIGQALSQPDANQRQLIRALLAGQLPQYDRECVAADREGSLKQVVPRLFGGRQMKELCTTAQAAGAPLPLPTTMIVTDLYCLSTVPVGDGAYAVPIDDQIRQRWNVSLADLNAQAVENLRKSTGNWSNESPMTEIELPGLGRYGHLKPGLNPAVVLLDEFLQTVRHNWKTQASLVVFLPSATGIRFVQRDNQALLDMLIPKWRKELAESRGPICENFLLLGGDQPTLLDYTPAAGPFMLPTSHPTTSHPVYIVR